MEPSQSANLLPDYSDPQKLCEIVNAYCSFQHLSFRVIIFAALLFFILLWLAKLSHLWVIQKLNFENHYARTFVHSLNNYFLYLMCAKQSRNPTMDKTRHFPDLNASCCFSSLHLSVCIFYLCAHTYVMSVTCCTVNFWGTEPLSGFPTTIHLRHTGDAQLISTWRMNFPFQLHCLPLIRWILAPRTGI